jgi:hypothetical protein
MTIAGGGAQHRNGALWQSEPPASATCNDVDDLIGEPGPERHELPPGYYGCAGNVARARL